MRYILMDYVREAGWPQLTPAEQERWLGAYKAYMQAMASAGVLKSSGGLHRTSTATTVQVRDDKPQVTTCFSIATVSSSATRSCGDCARNCSILGMRASASSSCLSEPFAYAPSNTRSRFAS